MQKHVWVPLQLPAVVVELVVHNTAGVAIDLGVRCSTRFRLSLGWPLGTRATARVWVGDGPSDTLRAANELGQAALTCEPTPRGWQVDADSASWDIELTCLPGTQARLRLVIAAGPSDPSVVARKAMRRADDLRRQRVDHDRRCAEAAPRLATPSPELDRAFAACRPALEDFKHHDPTIGLGYFAGFPAYNFYFAGDAFRMLYGACGVGDWRDSREALRTIIRGQRQTDDLEDGQFRGELWHELSTTGHQISPNFATLELPSILLHYVRWSGDVDFARETYPAAALAGAWAARKDLDSDGLPDNGPEQTFADGVREDLNVAGAHLTPAVWQLRAYLALAELAALVGDPPAAGAWRRRAGRARRLIESTFWHAERRVLVETIRPDGEPDSGPGFVPALEPEEQLDMTLRAHSLSVELDEERALQAGQLGLAASLPPEARQARAYYVMDRGDRARRLLEAGWADEGATALASIARLPFNGSQAGFFPEIAARSEELADPRGCFHQGWTPAYGLAYPVLAGLWGLRPDAARGRLQVAPTPPSAWNEMRLAGVRVGAAELELRWRRLADNAVELVVRLASGGPLEIEARLTCPPGARRVRLLASGRRLRTGMRRRLGWAAPRVEVGAQLTVRPRRPLRLLARWQPPRVQHTPSDHAASAPRVPHTLPGHGTPRRPAAIGVEAPPEVVYCGFLAPPVAARQVPLNYAARRPRALLDLLPTARVLVLTDQQDAPLSPPLADAVSQFVVDQGGGLLFFCYWSAAWGRGFFDTYCSLAASSVPELLPLAFRPATPVQTTRHLRLHGPGQSLWADLPWPTAPPLDYQASHLRANATCWATDATNDAPIAASWRVGAGRVVALGLDAFGFGHGTLVHWPGQRPLLRRALDWLLGPPT